MPVYSPYTFGRYVATTENVLEVLDKYGVAIIPNVLTKTEADNIVSGIWDYLEHISQHWNTPIQRNNEKTWREFYKLMPAHSMLLQFFGIGHAQVSWDVRQNEKVAECFAKIWNCSKEDLLVSFDGLSFHLPPEKTNKGWNRPERTWFHCDQSFRRSDFSCVQGWVSGVDICEGDATLAFFECSHKYHKEMADTIADPPPEEWYLLNEQQEKFYFERGCYLKKIKCPKGSLVLWDSRTIHCGVEASRKRRIPNLRAVIYVCYMPRALSTEKHLQKKRKAFDERRTTRHNPCKIGLFSKNPRTYGREMPEITPIAAPQVSEFGRKLAGF